MFCIAHTLGRCFNSRLKLVTDQAHIDRLVLQEHDLTRLLVLLGVYLLSFLSLASSLTWNFQILSVAFELAEYSLAHHLANFAEVRISSFNMFH